MAPVCESRLGRGGLGRGRRFQWQEKALRKHAQRRAVVDLSRSRENAMTTFRKARELLLASFDDGDISEDEFLLLYDANTSKNPDFPYQYYGHFVWQNFVFEKGTYPFSQKKWGCLSHIHANRELFATELKVFVFC